MTTNLETLLTALYVLIDDHVIPAHGRQRGRPRKLSDAELVCLAVAQVLRGARSEHHWLRICHRELPGMFPYLPKQPGYHKRVKSAAPLIMKTQMLLARTGPGWSDEVKLIDATPIPCGTSRTTVRRSRLGDWAGYGYCAAHSRWYWGLKLYLVTSIEGIPIAWCLARPNIGEAEIAAELLAHARDQAMLPEQVWLIGDKGFDGRAWHRDLHELRILFARPDKKNETYAHGSLGGIRQRIEAIIATLKSQLNLEHHHGRTHHGVITRIAQRLLALTAAIWHNWTTNAPVLRSLTTYEQ